MIETYSDCQYSMGQESDEVGSSSSDNSFFRHRRRKNREPIEPLRPGDVIETYEPHRTWGE